MADGDETSRLSDGATLPSDDSVLLAALQNYLLAAEHEAAKRVCAAAYNPGFGETADVAGQAREGQRVLLANLSEARKLARAFVRGKTPQLALKTSQKSVAADCVRAAADAVSGLYPGRTQIEVASNRGEIFSGDGDTVTLVLVDIFKAMAVFVPQINRAVRILAGINYDDQNNCIIEIATPYAISNFDFLFYNSEKKSETDIVGAPLCNSLLNKFDGYMAFRPSEELELTVCLCLPGVRN